MSGRVILFGATGFTGRLTAEAMTRAGLAPVLAGRSEEALVDLVGDLAGLGPIDRAPTWQRADVTDPTSVRALVSSPEDVLVTTVGPFARLGSAAVEAVVDAGCAYLDSTGEFSFIQQVFEDYGPRAEQTGARLLTAFGYDFVPGNLAAALAVRDCASTASGPVGVQIGYFNDGAMGVSTGTRASLLGAIGSPTMALRNGVVTPTSGTETFDTQLGQRTGILIGASELFAVPRLDARVRDVSVYLGWFGRWSPLVNASGTVVRGATGIPGFGSLVKQALAKSAGSATGGGPTKEARTQSRSIAVSRTVDGVGRTLSQAAVEGPNGYDLTAELLAWGAAMLLTRQEKGVGALGPVDGFGLEALEAGCADIGLTRAG